MYEYEQSKELKEKAERAEFLAASYNGGNEYKATGSLIQYKREDSADYEARVAASSYTNYCAPVIDSYIAFLFRDGVDRSDIDISAEIVNDIDANGTDIAAYSRSVIKRASIESAVGVLIDKPESTLSSRQDELDLGIHPYATTFGLDRILAYDYEVIFGQKVLMVLVLLEAKEEDYIEYKKWTPDKWVLYRREKNKQPKLKDEGSNPLGEIPFIPVINKGASLIDGISDIDDIADINRRIYNIDSNSLNLSNKTAFAMLQGPRAVIDADNVNGETIVGEENILAYDEENPNAKYEWLEPDNNSITRLIELKDDARSDINTISKLDVADVQKTGDAESGVALELKFQQLNALLSAKAEMAEDFEEMLFYFVSKWNGEEFNGTISYPRKFGIRDVSADLDTAIKSLLIIQSEKYKDMIAQTFVGRLLKDASKEDIDAINKELASSRSDGILNALNGGQVPNA